MAFSPNSPRSIVLMLCLIVSALGAYGNALETGKISKAAVYSINTWSDSYVVEGDGTWTETLNLEVQALNTTSLPKVSEQRIAYDRKFDEVQVLKAITKKRSGITIQVDRNSGILDQMRPSSGSSGHSDIMEKVILFRDVEAGDSILLSIRRKRLTTQIPGQFTLHKAFSSPEFLKSAIISISAPSAMPMTIETHGLVFQKSQRHDTTIYTWSIAKRFGADAKNEIQGYPDGPPRLFASSIPSYGALARAYAPIFLSKTVVTPQIKELADKITLESSARQDQIRRIYNWVTTHISPIVVDISEAGLVPHTAQEVLINGFGDCKDHVVLFAALLKAKGIKSSAALVNLGNAYTLPNAPMFYPLNHVISWIPDDNLYLDTTSGVASFGTLQFGEYNKPVVIIGDGIPSGGATPPLGSKDSKLSVKTHSKLSSDGIVTGTTTAEGAGPFASVLRSVALHIQSTGSKGAAEHLLQNAGVQGTGELASDKPDDLRSHFTISGSYTTKPVLKMLSGGPFAIPDGLRVIGHSSDQLLGPALPLGMTLEGGFMCFAGEWTDELSLTYPVGYRVQAIPRDVRIHESEIAFTSTWHDDGRTISVVRQLTTSYTNIPCNNAQHTNADRVRESIANSYKDYIALVAKH